ncbi:MAG TPA: hypothetical protein VMN58_13125 [Acidimicrobiales bacterium]|nr:hypothetical protein [Acidimicrobiales bacterium]
MTPTRRPARLAVALAALLVLSACSGNDDEESLETSGDRQTTTSVDGDGGDTDEAGDDAPAPGSTTDDAEAAGDGDGAEAGTGDPAPGGGDGSTTGGSTGGGGGTPSGQTSSPSAPDRPIVPRAGTYTYERTTTTEGSSPETARTDSVVERLSGDDRAGRVRLAAEGPQGKITSEADVSSEATLVDLSIIESPLGEIHCDWEPNWMLVGPYTKGSTWDFASSCRDEKPGLTVDIEISGTGTVVGYEQVEVNGATVNAWVIETTTVTDIAVTSPTVNGTQHSESVSRRWVDPALGMSVRDESTNDSSGDFQNGRSTMVSVLVGQKN